MDYRNAYLTSKDHDFIDLSCSSILQELTDDESTYFAGSGNSEVLEARHAYV